MTIAAIFFNAIILPITRFVNEDFCRIWQKSSAKCVSSIEKTGYPPIDIRFADRLAYYDAFDDAHEKQGVEAMEKQRVPRRVGIPAVRRNANPNGNGRVAVPAETRKTRLDGNESRSITS